MGLRSKLFVIGLVLFMLSGCGFYKFSGTSIPADVTTVSIGFFENRAPIIAPLLSQSFTEMLKDKFISETNLDVILAGGDYDISGYVSGYSITPVAVQDGENATQNRLTISINVKLDCVKYPKQNYEQAFVKFTDFDANADFASLEESLIEEINIMIVQEIFNKTAINW